MKTNETHAGLLAQISENDPDAYQALYEAATSSLLELTRSWSEGSHEETDRQLTEWSRLSRRICKRLNGKDSSLEYEAGRLNGIIEAFEYLYRQEEETKAIDAALAEFLSSSKPASKRVLHILYEAGRNGEWVSNARLEAECSQKANALSNIMKRLVRANAVEFMKEGRTVSYRISPAGKRYYEKNLSSLMRNDYVRELEEIKEITVQIQGMVEGLDKPVKQAGYMKHLEGVIKGHRYEMDNNILGSSRFISRRYKPSIHADINIVPAELLTQ